MFAPPQQERGLYGLKKVIMFFSSNAMGLELNSQGAAFALISGKPDLPKLERVSFRPFTPGLLRVSMREPNVSDPDLFVRILREAYALLLHQETRLSLTLPDGIGRVMLLDVEGRFKNRAEALDIIRWKLKKHIPFDAADMHLDYQQLLIRESGELALLVAFASREVVARYEELVVAAGLVPARIEFNALSLCRAFDKTLAPLPNVLLACFYGNALGIFIFHEGMPGFVRFKELPGISPVDRRVYTEINNSLLAYHERFPERGIGQALCVAPPDVANDFRDMLAETAGCTVSLLEAKTVVTTSDSAPADQQALFPFTAAIGAAMGNL